MRASSSRRFSFSGCVTGLAQQPLLKAVGIDQQPNRRFDHRTRADKAVLAPPLEVIPKRLVAPYRKLSAVRVPELSGFPESRYRGCARFHGLPLLSRPLKRI